MASDTTGNWGQPGFLGSGAPDVDGDPTAVADYYAAMVPRRFTTLALLLAATPPGNGYSAKADDCPGATWIRIAGVWKMFGIAVFASDAARAAILTAPAEDMVTIREDADFLEIYKGSAWIPATSKPYLSYTTATNQNVTAAAAVIMASPTQSELSGIIYNAATGLATAVLAGRYRVFGSVIFGSSTSGTKVLSIRKNGSGSITPQTQTLATPTQVTVQSIVNLGVGDTVELVAQANVSTALTSQHFEMEYVSA